jgi:hypothetical protein
MVDFFLLFFRNLSLPTFQLIIHVVYFIVFFKLSIHIEVSLDILSLSLSLTHTHTYTHTHKYIHIHTHYILYKCKIFEIKFLLCGFHIKAKCLLY